MELGKKLTDLLNKQKTIDLKIQTLKTLCQHPVDRITRKTTVTGSFGHPDVNVLNFYCYECDQSWQEIETSENKNKGMSIL